MIPWSKRNLPAIIICKDYAAALSGMTRHIEHMASRFSATSIPCSVLDRDDYVAFGRAAVMDAVDAFKLPTERPIDYEKCWAKFIFLCQQKVNSRMIEEQKRFYIPYKVSQKVARLHPKVKAFMNERDETTVRDIMKQFSVSEKVAGELLSLCNATFHSTSYHATDANDDQRMSLHDVPVEDFVHSQMFVADLLHHLDEREQQIVRGCAIEGVSVRVVAKELGIKWTLAEEIYQAALLKLRKVLCDGQLYHETEYYIRHGRICQGCDT